MPAGKWKHFCVMFLIGDGIMAVVRPERAAEAWIAGPKPWRDLMTQLSEHPRLTRAIGIVETAFGICWALRQENECD